MAIKKSSKSKKKVGKKGCWRCGGWGRIKNAGDHYDRPCPECQ